MKNLYLASPLGFSESGRDYMYNRLMKLLKKYFNVINPWDLTNGSEILEIEKMPFSLEKKRKYKELNLKIAKRNRVAIDESDFILAVLDGVDIDSGTASEIGYGFAKNKVIYGLRTDFRLAGDNIGALVNLQVEYFILQSKGKIFVSYSELENFLNNKI